jgi:hypothetical protein
MKDSATKQEDASLIPYLPLLSGILIFLGVCRLSFYYKEFGINIINFLEIGEIITSFLDKIILLGLVIVLGLVIGKYRNSFSSDGNFKSELSKLFLARWIVLFAFVGVAGLVQVVYHNPQFTGMMLAIGFLGPFFILLLTAAARNIHRPIKSNLFWALSISSLSILFLLYYSILIECQAIKTLKTKMGIEVIFDCESFKGDSSNFYIGNTKDYLFIYHQKTNQTSVYPMSSVKKIIYKK